MIVPPSPRPPIRLVRGLRRLRPKARSSGAMSMGPPGSQPKNVRGTHRHEWDEPLMRSSRLHPVEAGEGPQDVGDGQRTALVLIVLEDEQERPAHGAGRPV